MYTSPVVVIGGEESANLGGHSVILQEKALARGGGERGCSGAVQRGGAGGREDEGWGPVFLDVMDETRLVWSGREMGSRKLVFE